ncbi:nicotinamide riboside transporter PnuC [Novosphingobium sp. fls2-241-R2A-195]|jgi:nicotinamide mononucleotide transporter|uniref:nicotinamide riboside transporter PnuC n=1 Tax=Novosphingobium sp. fls2-241-R2A-195 TaxID=3040296 RepID=UPI002550FC2D|nr:nicotinamide riboside transporter PnuC [Novosphingobium sp. fls2-241-R2A-195]
MSILEIVAVVVSFLGIWFTARRWMLCWPVSLLACALYFKVFLDVRLYSDMMLQALFGVAILYGWASWGRGKADSGDIVVKPLSLLGAAVGLGAGAVGAAAIGWLASRYTDAALPWMDAGLSSFSLVAQYWTARRQSANWLLWIAVDVLYVGMFAFKDLWLTAGLYAAMVALAVLGYRRWRAAAARQGQTAAL